MLFAACTPPATVVTGDLGPVEQTPPTERSALEAWLAGGDYRRWSCETSPHAARPPGAHGATRVCNNDALHGAPAGAEFPVGAASVKELYDSASDTAIAGFAVALHISPGDCDSWYWYERRGGSTSANGVGVSLCTGCHTASPSAGTLTPDHCVYTKLP